jgi:hypothetical protein
MFKHSLTAKRIFLNALVLALLILMAAGVTDAQDRQLVQGDSKPPGNRKVALVMGNAGYETAPLKNPVNDSRDIAATLRELGFEVIYRENVNQNDMKRAIREFGERIRGGGVALFYYAGHGVQVKGSNYLVPIGARVENEADVEYECVDAGFVLAQMDSARNSMNIVILDACRNNPFARSFRSTSHGLAQMDAPSGTLIAYATSPGSIASDGTARNGLYTQELLKFVRMPNVSIEEVFKRVRISVRSLTQDKQTPWESSSLVGDFYFVGDKQVADSRPLPTQPSFDPAAVELSYWESIKNSNDPEDFKAYLEKYPNGQFANLARRRASQPTSSPGMSSGDPNLFQKYLSEGESALNSQNWAEAEKAYRNALQLNPNHALSHFNLGEALFAQKKYAEAEIEYRETARLEPNNALAHLYIGDTLFHFGKISEAEVEYRTAVRLDPQNANAHAFLADTLRKQARWTEAETEIQRALQLIPTKPLYQSILKSIKGHNSK